VEEVGAESVAEDSRPTADQEESVRERATATAATAAAPRAEPSGADGAIADGEDVLVAVVGEMDGDEGAPTIAAAPETAPRPA
jgi:hypothetical protein